MIREELVELRKKLMKGSPPYTTDPVLGNKSRKGGVAGLEERKAIGAFDPNSSGVILALEAIMQITDHLLEKEKD